MLPNTQHRSRKAMATLQRQHKASSDKTRLAFNPNQHAHTPTVPHHAPAGSSAADDDVPACGWWPMRRSIMSWLHAPTRWSAPRGFEPTAAHMWRSEEEEQNDLESDAGEVLHEPNGSRRGGFRLPPRTGRVPIRPLRGTAPGQCGHPRPACVLLGTVGWLTAPVVAAIVAEGAPRGPHRR